MLFWVILLTVCGALAWVMLVLFRSSAGAQIDELQARAEAACTAIATRYAKSLADPQREAPQLDLLQVLLQLVLMQEPRVEGGVWRVGGADNGFLAYAYPTCEGSSVKRDLPQAEQAHIAEVAQIAARTQKPETDVVRASREALIVSACPLQSPRGNLAAWTMTRTSLGMLDAQRSLRLGLGALLAVVQPLNLQLHPVDLPPWAEERIASARERAAAKRVRLHLRAETLRAELDPVHLARAVDHLIDNAVRHAPEGGFVRLSVGMGPQRGARDRLVFKVEDDGPGVPQALQGQLFEPFATGRPDDTGLGLALAREVALAHGGELNYLARPEGGARFELELPWRAC